MSLGILAWFLIFLLGLSIEEFLRLSLLRLAYARDWIEFGRFAALERIAFAPSLFTLVLAVILTWVLRILVRKPFHLINFSIDELSRKLAEGQLMRPVSGDGYTRLSVDEQAELSGRELLAHSLAAFKAGEIQDSFQLALLVVDIAEDDEVYLLALRQSSAALATMGYLDQSAEKDRQACEFATAIGDRKGLAQSLAHLAENLRKLGQLDQALEEVQRASAVEDLAACHANLYEIHRSAGRFEEALAELDRAALLTRAAASPAATKMLALFDFASIRPLLELGRLDEARERLERAARVFQDDPKLGLSCKAARSRIEALQGNAAQARQLMNEVAQAEAAFGGDRNTQQVLRSFRARTLQALGDFAEARLAWLAYLELQPDPVDRPDAMYRLGECLLALGDRLGAIEQFERAARLDLPTHESSLARQKLSDLAAQV